MRLGLTKEFDWMHIGAMLAQLTDEEQSTFLKGFLKECNSWGTRLQVEKQFAAINALLSKEEREALAMLSYEEETK